MNEETKKPAGSPEEDAALVRAFQSGDKTAFDALALKYRHKVFGICFWFLGDDQDAGDLAQDTFLKVYRSLKKFRLEASFSTWLYRIATNTCKNRLKSSEHRQKKKRVCLDNPGSREVNHVSFETFEQSPSPMAELEKKERVMLIRKAIGALPADKRTVIVLRDIEGLSYEEVSRITGHSLGTVKSRLSRARQELWVKLRGVV